MCIRDRCNTEFSTEKNKQKFCSRKCVDDHKRDIARKNRENNPSHSKNKISSEKRKYYRENTHVSDEEFSKMMITHGRDHHNKDRYSYTCDLCQCDMKVDKNDGSWFTQEEIAHELNISKRELGGFLLRKGLKNDKGKITSESLRTSNLYSINTSKSGSLSCQLWNREKIIKLYKGINV